MKIRELISLEFMSKPIKIMPTRYDFGMEFGVVFINIQISITKVPQLVKDELE